MAFGDTFAFDEVKGFELADFAGAAESAVN